MHISLCRNQTVALLQLVRLSFVMSLLLRIWRRAQHRVALVNLKAGGDVIARLTLLWSAAPLYLTSLATGCSWKRQGLQCAAKMFAGRSNASLQLIKRAVIAPVAEWQSSDRRRSSTTRPTWAAGVEQSRLWPQPLTHAHGHEQRQGRRQGKSVSHNRDARQVRVSQSGCKASPSLTIGMQISAAAVLVGLKHKQPGQA